MLVVVKYCFEYTHNTCYSKTSGDLKSFVRTYSPTNICAGLIENNKIFNES